MTRITIYGKPGCHLCEDVLGLVRAATDERGFELVEVDISTDPELHSLYGERIPVVAAAGAELSAPFGREALEQWLDTVAE